MPTIAVNKAHLYRALGKEYTKDEFDELCFEFGIELDEDTSESNRPTVDGVAEPPQLKIEIPANRYDMLCFEGIAMNLRVFLGLQRLPEWGCRGSAEAETLTIKEETMKTLASPQSKAGSVAAQVVAAIASVELPVGEWPEAIELLLRFVQTSEDVHLKVSTFQVIGYICESIVSGSFKQ